MKLTNVHYEYRGNDIWRIYFKDYKEADTFENERTDGKKSRYSPIIKIDLEVRWYVEAKLTGAFSILRRYVRDGDNKYSVPWANLVKKIEGSDSGYIFDEIDLWYNATADKCYFRICCMNGTWTDLFVKNMLNPQFGMVAHANGYYDTDTVGQGGVCVRRSCCGIGFDPSAYKTDKERIMFSVKDYCPNGKAYIIKVNSWTNTFIGTNKENEKEYSWSDFKHYMGLLRSDGSDIWDIEWEFDAACPMTGTEIADKLHVYLKPEAYKRLFEKEEKMVWLSTGTLWSNGDYLARVQALTPPPVPYWVNLDDDCKIGFRQKDADEVQKEIDEATKKIYEKLDIKFDADMTACEYCKRDVDICKEFIAATLKAKNSTTEPFIVFNNKVMTLAEFDAFINDTNNKEEKNMGPKDTTFSEFCRRLYWGAITAIKPTKVLIQGTATIIWWSDGTKTVVKCQKGDKIDPEKGIAMCVMKKFMGTNETHSNYLDFAKDAIAEYEKQQAEEKAKKKAEADKRRRAAAKRGAKAKAKTEAESKEES